MRSKRYLSMGGFVSMAFFLMLIAPNTAKAQQQSLPTRHTRPEVLDGEARPIGPMASTQRLDLAIMLPLRNEAELNDLLGKLYNPESPMFHQFVSVQQFTDLFGPTQEDYDAVIHFAESNGMDVTSTSPNRLVLGVSAPVSSVEAAFHVRMGMYQHPTESRAFFAPDREPSVDLAVALWHVGGLDNFSLPHPLYRKGKAGVRPNTTGSGPGGSFLGSDRRAAYYGGTSLNGSGQSVGLFELDGYNASDVQAYFTTVGQPLNVPINNVLLQGASGGSDGNDTEQVIDIIEAISMAPALSQVLVYIAPESSFSSGSTDTAIFNRMATDNIAKQLSVSWTWRPDDPGSDDPIFNEFAAQGQSLFVASGDDGSYPNSGYYFPAEDTKVTAVGGTALTTNGAGGSWQSETAWVYSGGGPSPDGIAIPSYQQLSGVINGSNGGSTTRRNAPDVAAEANTDNYFCANNGCGNALGGTSLAAPTWAGFAALINQQNAANGIPMLGFLNPSIYQIGVATYYMSYFHDITSGSNGSYSAVTGYDLVTGWGSPNFSGGGWDTLAYVSPTSVNFGTYYPGPVVDKSVYLHNVGSTTLSISGIVVNSGDDNIYLSNNTTCGSTLAVGASCRIIVEWDTSSETKGTKTGTLVITTSFYKSPLDVPLTGTIVCASGCP